MFTLPGGEQHVCLQSSLPLAGGQMEPLGDRVLVKPFEAQKARPQPCCKSAVLVHCRCGSFEQSVSVQGRRGFLSAQQLQRAGWS